MSVVSPAEVPLLPVKDRRMQFLAGGAISGFLLPAAGIVAIGAFRRRYRYSDEAAGDLASKTPLLGILPLLPHRLNDPDSAADAAQCVHQIRVMLQVNQPQEGSMAYMVTSACPGEGKTSLVAALAMSFAISGSKTLLVDADLIGQRLTRGFNAEGQPGFRDVVRDPAAAVHVVKTGTNNLSLLACGVSDGRDACAVSGRSLKSVIAAAKKRYDVVLVDSGPILGSLEASVMAQAVDSVILTISREQQKPLVDRAIAHLRSVGAHLAGIVFNKAERKDFYRSVGASSLRSVSTQNSESTLMIRAGVTATSGFGSLVDSVQSYMPRSA
jgi:capsular exopolysaccharide synthesis family protein